MIQKKKTRKKRKAFARAFLVYTVVDSAYFFSEFPFRLKTESEREREI